MRGPRKDDLRLACLAFPHLKFLFYFIFKKLWAASLAEGGKESMGYNRGTATTISRRVGPTQ